MSAQNQVHAALQTSPLAQVVQRGKTLPMSQPKGQSYKASQPQQKSHNETFTIRKDSFQLQPHAANASTGGTAYTNKKASKNALEAQEIRLFSQVNIDASTQSSKRPSVAAVDQQIASNMVINVAPKKLSQINTSQAAGIDLDTPLQLIPNHKRKPRLAIADPLSGTASPSLGLKKQMLAQQRLQKQIDDRPYQNAAVSNQGGTGEQSASDETKKRTGKVQLPSQVHSNNNLTQPSFEQSKRVSVCSSSKSSSKLKQHNKKSGDQNNLSQQVKVQMLRQQKLDQERGRITSISVIDDKAVSTISGHQSSTHLATHDSAESEHQIDVQLPAIRADRMSQEVRIHVASKSKQSMIQRNMQNILGKRTQEDSSPSQKRHKEISLKKKGPDGQKLDLSHLGSNASQGSLRSNSKRDSLDIVVVNQGGTGTRVKRTRVSLKNTKQALENIGAKQNSNSRQINLLVQSSNQTTSEITDTMEAVHIKPKIHEHYNAGVTSGEASLMAEYQRRGKNPRKKGSLPNQNKLTNDYEIDRLTPMSKSAFTSNKNLIATNNNNQDLFQTTMPVISPAKYLKSGLKGSNHRRSNVFHANDDAATTFDPVNGMVDIDPKRNTTMINRAGHLGQNQIVNGAQISARGVLRESMARNREESFKELMQFNLDNEFAKAERNLTKVNATQQFVNKALRGNIAKQRSRKTQQLSQSKIASQTTSTELKSPDVQATFQAPDGLKTSIKHVPQNTTVFKGINIMQMEDGKGLKFIEQNKARKVQFDV